MRRIRHHLKRALAASSIAALLVSGQAASVSAYHVDGYDSGNLGQCYTYGYIYSKVSYFADHYWKNFGYTYWYNSTPTHRQNTVPTPTWWAVEWDHSWVYSGAQCNS